MDADSPCNWCVRISTPVQCRGGYAEIAEIAHPIPPSEAYSGMRTLPSLLVAIDSLDLWNSESKTALSTKMGEH